MTATAALTGAGKAGLLVWTIDDQLRIRGVAPVAEVWRPILEPLTNEICALLEPASGVLVPDDRRCAGCGRGPFLVLVESDVGARFCRSCMESST